MSGKAVRPERVIAAVTAALVRSEPRPEAIVTAAVEALTLVRPAMWVASLLSKDPTVIQVVARDDRTNQVSEYLLAYQRASGFTIAPVQSRVIESGEPLLIPRLPWRDYMDRYLDAVTRSHLESHPFPAHMGEVSALIVPIRAGGATIGSLGMFLRETTETVDAGDIGWLQMAADQTGLAVQNAQLSVDASNRMEKIDAFHAMQDAMRSSYDVNVLLSIVVHRVRSILNVDACDVLLMDEASEQLITAAASGFAATSVAEFRLALDNPLLRQALESRRVEDLRSSHVPDEPRRRSLFAREGFRSYAVFPMTAQGRWLGALEVFHRGELHPDPEWYQFLESLAGIASIAAESSQLHERMSQQARFRKPSAAPNLSSIETQILRFVVEGMTNREIAAQVHLSQSTIKFHIRQILDKTGASNRTDLTRRATREGWV